jgi:hypothetical protein
MGSGDMKILTNNSEKNIVLSSTAVGVNFLASL